MSMAVRLVVGTAVVAVLLGACGTDSPVAGSAAPTPRNTTTTGVSLVTSTTSTGPLIDRFCVWPTTTTHAPDQVPVPGPPYRPVCHHPSSTPKPTAPPTTFTTAVVRLSDRDNGTWIAVPVGTTIVVSLANNPKAEGGPADSRDATVVERISATARNDGSSTATFRAIGKGQADLVGSLLTLPKCVSTVSDPCPTYAIVRPFSWAAVVTVF